MDNAESGYSMKVFLETSLYYQTEAVLFMYIVIFFVLAIICAIKFWLGMRANLPVIVCKAGDANKFGGIE
ncbi:MAG: hypothetical protein Q9M30_02740 [Mariprofundaceae bacterium]|nr:hypothetical protein [Mariprofundaceae bacterium]